MSFEKPSFVPQTEESEEKEQGRVQFDEINFLASIINGIPGDLKDEVLASAGPLDEVRTKIDTILEKGIVIKGGNKDKVKELLENFANKAGAEYLDHPQTWGGNPDVPSAIGRATREAMDITSEIIKELIELED